MKMKSFEKFRKPLTSLMRFLEILHWFDGISEAAKNCNYRTPWKSYIGSMVSYYFGRDRLYLCTACTLTGLYSASNRIP